MPGNVFLGVSEHYISDTEISGTHSLYRHIQKSDCYGWWSDEQPSDEIKRYVEQQIKEKDFDVITSPLKPFSPALIKAPWTIAPNAGSIPSKNRPTTKCGTAVIGISISASIKCTSSSTALKLTKTLICKTKRNLSF